MSTEEPTKESITNWASKDGSFKRQSSVFRDSIEPSTKKDAKYPAAKGRYYLYVSLACPWATRVLIVRKLKGLEELMPLSVVDWHMPEGGWRFKPDVKDATSEPLYGFEKLSDLYFKCDAQYNGRYTVPVIWDSKTEKIVNNESSEIIRFLNTAFNEFLDEKHAALDFYPQHLRSEIDEINDYVYNTLNNGVYKSGFATTQEAYQEAVVPLFKTMQRLEEHLEAKTYLVGDTLTEADIRLFVTTIRFDPVYVGHFKCNLGTIRHNFPNVHRHMKHLYWDVAGFKETTNFEHIKSHYYTSHPQVNPTRIVPVGPKPDIEPK